jgi:tetratricopeptide (TPR) repeat protein
MNSWPRPSPSGNSWRASVAAGTSATRIACANWRRALRDKPGNADRTIDLAEFLFDNSGVRGEQVEPRSGWRGYRYQTDASKEREITRAETLVNEVLDKAPNHLRGLGLKVRIRLYYQQNADADQFYKRMLALEAKDPNSLVVYAEMLDAMAWQKAGEAASLRAQDGSVTYSGDWMITHYLTEEGWRQVRANEALANEFAGLAARTLEQAAKALKGTPRGDYYQAKLFLRDGNAAAARDSLQNAIKADPEYVQAYDLLSSTLARLGDEKGSFQARLRAWGRVETSAGPALTGSRPLLVATRFQSARDLLEDALATDPADARVYSYIAVSHAEDENHEDGLKWFRGALAMEEARARQQGTSYKEGGKDIRSVSDFGLSMAIRQRMINILRATGRPPAERLELARASTGVDQRIPISDWTSPVYTSMIPGMDEEPDGLPPQVPEAVELLAWARIEAGRALHDMGDYRAAVGEYQAVYTYQKQYREYVVNRAENLAFVEATRWAALGLGYTNLKLDNYDGAVACLQQIPSRMTPRNALEKAGVELAAAVKEYKEAHGILSDQEKQIKDIDDMNAANRKMVEDELRRREEENKQYDEQRREQMEEMKRRNQEIDEQRKKQMEDMRRRRQR